MLHCTPQPGGRIHTGESGAAAALMWRVPSTPLKPQPTFARLRADAAVSAAGRDECAASIFARNFIVSESEQPPGAAANADSKLFLQHHENIRIIWQVS